MIVQGYLLFYCFWFVFSSKTIKFRINTKLEYCFSHTENGIYNVIDVKCSFRKPNKNMFNLL